jgi:hypothetical protein
LRLLKWKCYLFYQTLLSMSGWVCPHHSYWLNASMDDVIQPMMTLFDHWWRYSTIDDVI